MRLKRTLLSQILVAKEGFGTNELIFAATSFSTTLVHNSKRHLLLGERSGLGKERKKKVSDFVSSAKSRLAGSETGASQFHFFR